MESNEKVLKFTGRIVAGAFYDYQEVRKAMMNRVRDVIRKKAEGISFDEVEERKSEEERRKQAAKYGDAKLPERLAEIKDQLTDREYNYLRRTLELASEAIKMENKYKKMMDEYIVTEKVYHAFLKHIIGVSTILSANLIKEFGYCETYVHASSVWKHCGLDVQNGRAPKMKKGVKAKFSPRLRTMAWKISDEFIKQRTPVYRDEYDREKARQIAMLDGVLRVMTVKQHEEYDRLLALSTKDDPKKWEKIEALVHGINEKAPVIPKHADMRARRKAAKLFLEHYWHCGRDIAGLPTGKPWVFRQKDQAHAHYISWQDAVEANDKERARRKLAAKKKREAKDKEE